MQKTTLFLSFVVALLLPLWSMATEFEDFEALAKKIAANIGYRGDSKDGYHTKMSDIQEGSRLDKEIRENLTKLVAESRKIQEIVVVLKLEDINLPQETARLNEAYNDRIGKAKYSTTNKVGDSTGIWYPLSKLLTQIHQLKAMGFSVEDKSIKKTLPKKTALQEFEDILNYYSHHIEKITDVRNNSAWRTDFEKKLARFKYLGRNIQEKLTKEGVKDINITKEVLFLCENYYQPKGGGLEKNASDKEKKNSDKEKNSGTSDMMYSMTKLREYIVQLKDSKFSMGEVVESQKDEKKAVEEKTEETDYSAMNVEELFKKIQDERDRIYKANNKMDGISEETLKDYIKLLTKAQRERYNYLVKKYRERDYDQSRAQQAALLEIHGYYRNQPRDCSKDEMVKILNDFDKEKEKGKGK
ncbi:MAG: hypothetical protein A2X49_01940 [Lentisphaerae bacterium GWF2_52_8]|nr:MAG: hypothetical protein A2X49_01940 [Lentisphaerae bacterium GWF2_52_8]